MKDTYPHKCLSVLGNEVRINIIAFLQEKPMTVNELCKKIGKEQSLVSHALKQLRHCNFVDFRKNGKEREYYLKSDIFKKKNKPLFELIEEHATKYCGKTKKE